MKLSELKAIVDEYIHEGNGSHEVVVSIKDVWNASIGRLPSVGVSNFYPGFDWEYGQMRLETDDEICLITSEIEEALAKQAPANPVIESLADRNCPVCGAGINWDGLNQTLEEAPRYCSHCGQKFAWGDE